MVVQVSKDGHLYILDAANLGGIDGFKVDFTVASGAMAVHSAPGSYKTAMGTYVMLSTDSGAVCPAGSSASGRVVMAVRLAPGNPPVPTVAWCASLATQTTGPIATSTDGQNNVVVWYMSGGTLKGVDGDTGAAVYSSSNTCSGVQQWTAPIAANGKIVVGATGHLCSWSAP
jgi:hypothetical protein